MHVDADTLVFLREAPTGAVLVLARRAAGHRSGSGLTAAGVPAGPDGENVYGGAPALRPRPPTARSPSPADGPTFQVWRLPDAGTRSRY